MDQKDRELSPASKRVEESQAQAAPRPGCLVVGMGASAGGLEAFEQFFTHMPADSGMAFVLVQHLAPDHASLLPELLAKYTRMPVQQVTAEMPVEPNHVYVIPPDATLTIKGGVLHVESPPAEPRGHRTPIDHFFRSLAADQDGNAVCIILSGTGTDGTLGLQTVKEYDGMTMAQTTDSAQYDSILRSAIATGLVDHVLPVAEMPAKLVEYATHLTALHENGGSDGLRREANNYLSTIHMLLRRQTGHDFSQYKESTILRRLQRRMQALQIDAVDTYIARLRQDPIELEFLFKDLLIGVTHFFRDPEAFTVLAREVVPKMFANKGADDQVRVCVTGCATGEEAYSLAIILCEYMERLDGAPHVQVFATDIDEHALEAARRGYYPVGIAEYVSPERLGRFFVKQENMYQVKKGLREMCIFSAHSFIKDPPFSRLDLFSCRNVLIYLGPVLQQKLLPLFHYAVRPGGYLFLGPSETLNGRDDLFRTLDQKHRIFQRKEVVPRPQVEFPLTEGRQLLARRLEGLGNTPAAAQDIGTLTQRTILEHYAPAGVVVTAQGDAVHFSGHTGPYLEPPPGTPNVNVLHMAREGLRLPLRTALHQAVTRRQRVVDEHVSVKTNGSVQPITLVVQPLTTKPDDDATLYLVIFQDVSPAGSTAHTEVKAAASGLEDEQIRRLEGEIRATEERLHSAIEELETANEELQSANEEFQSTNEELVTSKEELQSLNEELETVNTELRRKVEDINRANSDLQNLMNSTQIATLFLDAKLRIRSFTPSTRALLRLTSGDIGRPIADFAPRFVGADLVSEAQGVLSTLATRERQLHMRDADTHYLMRILPYLSVENFIDGVVIAFVDVSDLKHAEEAARNAQVYAEGIVETVREPLLVLTAGLHVRSANRSFYEAFHGTPATTEGRLLYELGDGQWDIPELRRVLTEVLPQNQSFEDFEVTHDFPVIGQKTMLLNARQVVSGSTELILLAIKDITTRKREEEASLRLAAIVESSDDAIVSKSLDGVVTSWNAAAERIFGYRAEEMIGKPILLLLPEARHDEELMILERMRKGEHVDHFETVRRTKDGRLLDVSLTVSPLRNAHGTIIGASKIAHDITARKQVEEALTASEQRWRTLAETLPVLVWMARPDGFLDYCNQRWYDYTGMTPEQLLGWGWEAVWHPEDLPEGRARWLESLRSGQPYEHEARLRRADGSHCWHLNRGVSLRDQAGRVVRWVGTNTNTEEQKHMAVEMQRVNDELQQFAYIVSHDLNEPLRTMSSFIALLARKYEGKLDATADEYIAFAVDGAKRMQEMITDLLAYIRTGGQSQAFAPVDGEAVLARVLTDLQMAIADTKAEITYDPLPTVQGDAALLGQMLQNLIGNALKFRGQEPPRIHVSAQRDGQHWRFSVRDNGIGIDPQQATRIFQVFQRLHTRSEYPGTGIGLAICKKIVEHHGGRIWVESRAGEGSILYFTISDIEEREEDE